MIIDNSIVLINCDLGSEKSVISELKFIEGITEIHGIVGAYEVLARVESKQIEMLHEIITWKIRKLSKIRSTLTLMGIEG
jgi:hypothetical protein